jgi:chaperonin cofactor prefoldin
MSNPVIVETDLKDVLAKIDSRLERIEIKLESLPRIEEKLDGLEKRVDKLETSQNRQIWVLIVAVIGAIIKFGFFSNP